VTENKGLLPRDNKSDFIFSMVDYVETWQGMEDVFEAGFAKSID
jgi:hypothetical protein